MLFSYFKRHYKLIIMLAVFCVIFAAVFALYGAPAETVLYASLLCISVGAVFFGFGLYGYRRRHALLFALRKNILISLDGLPEPKDETEADYQALLKIQRDELLRLESDYAAEKGDMISFYTLWAHQIKTPIAAMSLLLESDECDKRELSAELFSIERYTEMVLSYLRLDAQSGDYLIREYDLDAIIRSCLRKYAKMFILKRLPVDFTETRLTVLTDEKWLSFVVGQLLSNALKYTRVGKISVYAEGRTLVIADTGIGIRAEDLPRVGEKGFTGYNGREDKKSTGLGLYLCRQITARLGHSMRIESKTGVGTRVYINLESGERVIE